MITLLAENSDLFAQMLELAGHSSGAVHVKRIENWPSKVDFVQLKKTYGIAVIPTWMMHRSMAWTQEANGPIAVLDLTGRRPFAVLAGGRLEFLRNALEPGADSFNPRHDSKLFQTHWQNLFAKAAEVMRLCPTLPTDMVFFADLLIFAGEDLQTKASVEGFADALLSREGLRAVQ